MINPNYIPEELSDKDKRIQKQQIKKSREDYKKGIYSSRPKLKSFKGKTSKHIVDFQNRYPHITSMKEFDAMQEEFGISREAIETVLRKGKGAYFSNGSRPNQTSDSWAYARLASTLLGRKACNVDKHVFKGTDITCKKLADHYKSKTSTKMSSQTRKHSSIDSKTHTDTTLHPNTSKKPYQILRKNVMISYFKKTKNPMKKVKEAIQLYAQNRYSEIYGKSYGIKALKEMGLVEDQKNTYRIINTKEKPYLKNIKNM